MRALVCLLLLSSLCGLVARAQDPRLAEAQKLSEQSAELQAAGQYAKSAEVFERAIVEFKRVAGADHPKVSEFMLHLAQLHLYAAAYDRAEPIMRSVLAEMETKHGKSSPMLLASLSSLATLYTSMGSYDRAQPMYERALAIVRADEPNGQNAANLIAAIGALHTFRQEYDAAIPLLKDALQRYETLFGVNHPDVASPAAALGAAYDGKDDPVRAEPLYVRALKLREAKQGATHPQTALMRNNLAAFYLSQGSYAKAEPLSRKALADTEAAFGPFHPQTGNLLNTLAFVLASGSKPKEAVPLLQRAADSTEQILRNARLTSTESRMAQFLQLYAWQESMVYALATALPGDADAVRLAAAVALLRKGRGVDEAADLSRVVQASLSPEDRQKFEQLRQLRGKLAALALGGAQGAENRAAMKQMEIDAERIEQELALRSLALRTRGLLPGPAEVVKLVAARLPADAVLVEIVAHTPFDFKATRKQARTLPLRYLAIVVDAKGGCRLADLGPAAAIDAGIGRLMDAYNHGSEIVDMVPAQELYALVMKPLEPLLAGKTHLLLSPDGQLHLLPFDALHDGKTWLGERLQIDLVGSGRDLLRDHKPQAGLVVLADPLFLGKAAPQLKRGLLAGAVPQLPGTRKEAEALRKLVPGARLVMGAGATEEALLATRAPGVLHVATHGVFLSDLPDAADNTRGLKVAAGPPGNALASDGEGPKNPLLRSALVLAGAASGGKAGGQDGLATALEIAGMNLWGTELVVLSACDTGRGDVKLGQGVFGLRRALMVAGAETVVTSLWKVDDDATRDLMVRFYGALRSGVGRAEALRRAEKEVRATRPHPYYWAPFLAIGQAGPVDALKATK